MRFEYSISVPSFIPVHCLVFSVHVLTPKNKKKMMTKPLAPSLYTKHYHA